MSGQPESAYVNAVDWPDRPRDTHPDTLAWIARIEVARRGLEAPVTRRCCGPCGDPKPLGDFARSSTPGSGGRAYICKRCKAAEYRDRYRRRKVAQFRAVFAVERAS